MSKIQEQYKACPICSWGKGEHKGNTALSGHMRGVHNVSLADWEAKQTNDGRAGTSHRATANGNGAHAQQPAVEHESKREQVRDFLGLALADADIRRLWHEEIAERRRQLDAIASMFPRETESVTQPA